MDGRCGTPVHKVLICQWAALIVAPRFYFFVLSFVLECRLEGGDWIMSVDYTIADISLLGWVRNLIGFYEARELVGIERFPHVTRVLDVFLARPAVVKGLDIPNRN